MHARVCGRCEVCVAQLVEVGGENEVEGVGEGLVVECCEGVFLCGDVKRVDVRGEDAVREVDFWGGRGAGPVDVEHCVSGWLAR